jgi:hypothetical protein
VRILRRVSVKPGLAHLAKAGSVRKLCNYGIRISSSLGSIHIIICRRKRTISRIAAFIENILILLYSLLSTYIDDHQLYMNNQRTYRIIDGSQTPSFDSHSPM